MKALLSLALVLSSAVSAFAADATFAKLQGPVFVKADGSKQYVPAKVGGELIYGDSVKTGAGATAQIALRERGAVLIRENSFFRLEGNTKKTMLNFSVGEFLIGLRKKLAQDESFKVRTPSAVAAVRGTLFWGKTDDKKSSTYAGFGHTIAVTAKGKTVLVHAGETTTIPFGEAPAAVTKHTIPVAYTDNFKVDGSLQGLETLVDLPK